VIIPSRYGVVNGSPDFLGTATGTMPPGRATSTDHRRARATAIPVPTTHAIAYTYDDPRRLTGAVRWSGNNFV
jgi:hypothetical protein